MWTIYDSPADHPLGFVVREWRIDGKGTPLAGELTCCLDTLETARAAVPPGLIRLERNGEDDPTIVETWI
jgi:hypothetical protein